MGEGEGRGKGRIQVGVFLNRIDDEQHKPFAHRLLLCRKATDIKKYLSILTFCVPPISKIIIINARRRLVVVLDRPNSQEVAPRSASIDIVQKKRKEKMKKTVKR